MFFHSRIKSIKESDKVLEIGPGATPYFRSDVFLELNYSNEKDRIAQSGHVGVLKTTKEIVFYDGGTFPFVDDEFDYIICSHVLEHVDDANFFLQEIQRVGKRGYIEYPTIYYDYLYNFPEHKLFLFAKNGVINWMSKEESGLNKFACIQSFFYRTCELEYFESINDFREYFFQGFEWEETIKSKHVTDFSELTYSKSDIILEKKEFKREVVHNIYANVSLKKLIKYKLKFFLGKI